MILIKLSLLFGQCFAFKDLVVALCLVGKIVVSLSSLACWGGTVVGCLPELIYAVQDSNFGSEAVK